MLAMTARVDEAVDFMRCASSMITVRQKMLCRKDHSQAAKARGCGSMRHEHGEERERKASLAGKGWHNRAVEGSGWLRQRPAASGGSSSSN